jgi:hypothetical protein
LVHALNDFLDFRGARRAEQSLKLLKNLSFRCFRLLSPFDAMPGSDAQKAIEASESGGKEQRCLLKKGGSL